MFTYNLPKLERIIDNFKKKTRKPIDYHVQFCLDQENLKDAIEVAAKAVDDYGKIHFHQRRVGKADLLAFSEKLEGLEDDFSKAKTFDEIYDIVKNTNAVGINEVTVFDAAFRIGNYLNILPDKIYLTSGTRIGAGYFIENLETKIFILPEELPTPFQRKDLTINDIEEMLYECKDDFRFCVK